MVGFMPLGGETPILKGRGVKNVYLVPFRVFILTGPTVGAFALPFRAVFI